MYVWRLERRGDVDYGQETAMIVIADCDESARRCAGIAAGLSRASEWHSYLDTECVCFGQANAEFGYGVVLRAIQPG